MKIKGENRSTLEETCPSATFVHHKSHMDRPGIEPGRRLIACAIARPSAVFGRTKLTVRLLMAVTAIPYSVQTRWPQGHL